MKNEIKIAKELVRIAKSLVSEQNVAYEPGQYKNFTGTIDFGDIKAKVKNATFSLSSTDPQQEILWEDGIWENGLWHLGTWKKGTWKKGTWGTGTWESGVWENGKWMGGDWKQGTWKNGLWYDGYWYDGIWENGKWNTDWSAQWFGGIWKGGKDMYGNDHRDSPDKWYK